VPKLSLLHFKLDTRFGTARRRDRLRINQCSYA
jgi:hypothetical protein